MAMAVAGVQFSFLIPADADCSPGLCSYRPAPQRKAVVAEIHPVFRSDGRAAPSLPPAPPPPPKGLAPGHVQQLGAVDLAELAAEGGAGDEAAPPLADEGGVDEARGVVGREAEEELLDELVHERRRRRRHLDWCGGGQASWALLLHMHMHIWTQMGL